MENVERQLKTLLANPLIYGVLAIIVTMYGPRLSPKPPAFLTSLFNSAIFRFLVMVLVIYVGSEDLKLALAVSVVFLIIMSVVNTANIKEDFTQQVKNYVANYNLYESSHLPNNSEHFTENMSSGFNIRCTFDAEGSPSSSAASSRSASPTRKAAAKPVAKQGVKAAAKRTSPSKPVAKRTSPSKPVAKRTSPSKPVAKRTSPSKPVAKPVAKPAAKAVAKPISPSKPVAKRTSPSKPVAKPVAKPAAKAVAKVTKRASKPASKSKKKSEEFYDDEDQEEFYDDEDQEEFYDDEDQEEFYEEEDQ
jgi:hypothetical protein